MRRMRPDFPASCGMRSPRWGFPGCWCPNNSPAARSPASRPAGPWGDALTLFLVEPKAKGIETERTTMVDSHNAARITFDHVEVNADGVLGEVDQGHQLLEGVLNIGRGAVASEMVGLSEEVFGRTVGYLKERKKFGKAIGEFQALQHRPAQLYIEIEITRAAVLKL